MSLNESFSLFYIFSNIYINIPINLFYSISFLKKFLIITMMISLTFLLSFARDSIYSLIQPRINKNISSSYKHIFKTLTRLTNCCSLERHGITKVHRLEYIFVCLSKYLRFYSHKITMKCT